MKRSCGCDTAPTDLRGKVLARIERIRAGLPVEGDLVPGAQPAAQTGAAAEAAVAVEVGAPAGSAHDAVSHAVAEASAKD